MTLTGVVKNFGGLLTMRLLLGIFEYVKPNSTLCFQRVSNKNPELGSFLDPYICAPSGTCPESSARASPHSSAPARYQAPFPVFSRPESARWMELADMKAGAGSSSLKGLLQLFWEWHVFSCL
jgi:hypothetical protein